jgi:hypothetical protein
MLIEETLLQISLENIKYPLPNTPKSYHYPLAGYQRVLATLWQICAIDKMICGVLTFQSVANTLWHLLTIFSEGYKVPQTPCKKFAQ